MLALMAMSQGPGEQRPLGDRSSTRERIPASLAGEEAEVQGWTLTIKLMKHQLWGLRTPVWHSVAQLWPTFTEGLSIISKN